MIKSGEVRIKIFHLSNQQKSNGIETSVLKRHHMTFAFNHLTVELKTNWLPKTIYKTSPFLLTNKTSNPIIQSLWKFYSRFTFTHPLPNPRTPTPHVPRAKKS